MNDLVVILIPIVGIVMGAVLAFYAAKLSDKFCRSTMLGAVFSAAGNAAVIMAIVAKVAGATLAIIGITAAETAAVAAIATITVYCALSLCGKRAGMAAVV